MGRLLLGRNKKNNGIAITAAKAELVRINEVLGEPELLIGGIAVNYYDPTRRSVDIDLVCSDGVALELIERLYPFSRYKCTQTGNEERPTYIISDTLDHDAFGIVFGPKIVERGGYKLLDWDTLFEEARPLTLRATENIDKTLVLNNILVPSPEDLIYTKIISFFGRSEEKKEKRIQDLKDIVNLSNNTAMNVRNFRNRIRLVSAVNEKEIVFEFLKAIKTEDEVSILRRSWLFEDLVRAFATSKPKEGGIDYNYEERATVLSDPLTSFIQEIVDPEFLYSAFRPARSQKTLERGERALEWSAGGPFLSLACKAFEEDSDYEKHFREIVRRHTYRATELPQGEGVGLAQSSLYIDLHSASCNPEIRAFLADQLWGYLKYLGESEFTLRNFTIASPSQGNNLICVPLQEISGADLILVRTSPQIPKFGIPIEGEFTKARPVILVDDLCMDAHFLLRAVERIRAAGGHVQHVVTLLERNDAVGRQKLLESGVKLHSKYIVDATAYASSFPERRS